MTRKESRFPDTKFCPFTAAPQTFTSPPLPLLRSFRSSSCARNTSTRHYRSPGYQETRVTDPLLLMRVETGLPQSQNPGSAADVSLVLKAGDHGSHARSSLFGIFSI